MARPSAEDRIHRVPTLAEQVYSALRDQIIEGTLRPEERLVFEQLATMYGVSQTPVREAVVRLVDEGLVAPGPDGKLAVVALTDEYVNDICLVRADLEGLAAKLAASRLSDTEFEGLHALLETSDRMLASGNTKAYDETIAMFHQRIRDAAGSPTLARELSSLNAHIMFMFAYDKTKTEKRYSLLQEEHWEIMEALRRGDGATARLLVEHHMLHAADRVSAILQVARKQVQDSQ